LILSLLILNTQSENYKPDHSRERLGPSLCSVKKNIDYYRIVMTVIMTICMLKRLVFHANCAHRTKSCGSNTKWFHNTLDKNIFKWFVGEFFSY